MIVDGHLDPLGLSPHGVAFGHELFHHYLELSWTNRMTPSSEIIDSFRPWLLLCCLFASIGCSFTLALRRSGFWTIVGMGAVGLATCLVVSLPEIKTLRLGPLTAEMQTAINKANATVDQLRDLAVVLAQPVLGSLETQGRLAGGGLRAANYQARDRVLASLSRLGLSTDQIAQAVLQFDYYVEVDLYFDAYKYASSGLPNNQKGPVNECFGISGDFIPEITNGKDVNSIATCLSKVGPLSDEAAETLRDLVCFNDHKSLRRPDIYFSRGG